ncbi:hypothetical protein CPB84DRAFT_1681957 [Gymnopilus junonius]|uniref:Uncharacterized protein n=1 Tax=Gymnopilus junonius TaxID=109634 RepID=A0A9P5NMT0_GYMJU|nr:hypothetical protein CPB84DRAFT_1681957 [Gymnopilus junonius]
MQYAACTDEDIAFLRTRIVEPRHRASTLEDSVDICDVAIITRFNKTKDCINDEASQRFAAERGLQLHDFCSIDKLASSSKPGKKQKDKIPGKKASKGPCYVSQADQEMLWSCSPHTNTKKVPAKLSLCVGMPVIIRYNEATELCITRGQDALVVGWNASEGPYGRQVLETLFVKLVNPPKEVNIPDLPTNVVPLSRMMITTKCCLRSDCEITIQCQQVAVAPNFAITDYTSQGKTHDINVIDIADSDTHFSIYTCLSQSSTAAGTFIIRDFDDKVIMSGLEEKGWLRQEFRELNMLDEITHLQYEDLLPNNIFGPLRNPTLRAYHLWRKGKPEDKGWHSELRYSPREKVIAEEERDGTWDLSINASTLAKGIVDSRKRKKKTENVLLMPKKVLKISTPEQRNLQENSPHGLIWDPVNYSCAYDSVFTVLYNIWLSAPDDWSCRFDDISPYMSKLANELKKSIENQQMIENARDAMRVQFQQNIPDHFPTGHCYTSINYLCEYLLNVERQCGSISLICDNDNCQYSSQLVSFGEYMRIFPNSNHLQSPDLQNLSTFFGWEHANIHTVTKHICPLCCDCGLSQNLKTSVVMQRMPYIIFWMFHRQELNVLSSDCDYVFRLHGIIYSGQGHFVSRIIDDQGTIWFHDGITTGSHCKKEKRMEEIPHQEWLNTCRMMGEEKPAIIMVYNR